jgi:hypothetical protein
MERRGYFIIGDALACATAGAVAAWLSWLAVPAEWNTALWIGVALVLGMAVGMFAGLICGLLFMPFFGAMEIVVPAVLSGVLAGMIAGMLHAAAGIGPVAALWSGALAGLAALAYTYVLQARLAGDAT